MRFFRDPAWAGHYLGHCRPGGFAARAQYEGGFDVCGAHVQRGGRTRRKGPKRSPGLLKHDDISKHQRFGCRKHVVRSADLAFAEDGQSEGGNPSVGGVGGCCLSRCFTLADNIGVDIRVSSSNESSVVSSGYFSVACMVGRMEVGPFEEHQVAEEVGTDARDEGVCRSHGGAMSHRIHSKYVSRILWSAPMCFVVRSRLLARPSCRVPPLACSALGPFVFPSPVVLVLPSHSASGAVDNCLPESLSGPSFCVVNLCSPCFIRWCRLGSARFFSHG